VQGELNRCSDFATDWAVRGSNPGAGRDFPQMSTSLLEPTQTAIHWVPGFFPWDKARAYLPTMLKEEYSYFIASLDVTEIC
jgi:hypothetical protein